MNSKNDNLMNSKSNDYNQEFILNSSFSKYSKENDIFEDSDVIKDDVISIKNIISKNL